MIDNLGHTAADWRSMAAHAREFAGRHCGTDSCEACPYVPPGVPFPAPGQRVRTVTIGLQTRVVELLEDEPVSTPEAGTCATCRWWDRRSDLSNPPWGSCACPGMPQLVAVRAAYPAWSTSGAFGCNQYEAKPTDWRAVALQLRACLNDAVHGYPLTQHSANDRQRWQAAVDACPTEEA